MKKIYLFLIILIIFGAAGAAQAQTVSLTPASVQANQNSAFSLNVNISAENLFSVYFDLDYNPSLMSFAGATEGTFMSQGCETAFMTAENPAGKLIVGLTRLGESCGGISGSGSLMTLNFNSLTQNGATNLTFSNNGLTVYSGGTFSDIIGTWIGGSAIISQTVDTTPPNPPGGLQVF
jgi:hypothetical protein